MKSKTITHSKCYVPTLNLVSSFALIEQAVHSRIKAGFVGKWKPGEPMITGVAPGT